MKTSKTGQLEKSQSSKTRPRRSLVSSASAIRWASVKNPVATYPSLAAAEVGKHNPSPYRVLVVPLAHCTVIKRAAAMLIEDAQCLRQSHTINGKWDRNEAAAKASFDDYMRTAADLRALLPKK